MARYTTTLDVDAEPADAFAYLADFANAATWDPGVVSAKQVGEGPVGVGTEFDVTVAFYTKRIELRYVVEEFDEPKRLTLRASSRRAKSFDVIEVAERDGGGSTVTYDSDFRLGGALNLFDKGLQVAFDSAGKRAGAGIVKALAD